MDLAIGQRWKYTNPGTSVHFIAEVICVAPYKCKIVQTFDSLYKVDQEYFWSPGDSSRWACLVGQDRPT